MATDKPEKYSLKDHLFNRKRIQYLANLFHAADSGFDHRKFVRDAMKGLKKLELKERIVHIAESLERHLDDDFRVSAAQIVAALPPPLDPTLTDDDFGDFIFSPLGEFVVRNGSAKKHLKVSLRTLRELTKRHSMEDAIRAFINAHTDATMAELRKWATDRNYHVRRLASEGTRAMLPWSKRLTIDLTDPLPLLDQLHADPTRYVTRSVANHLNDIAKTKPKLVVDRLKRWKKSARQQPDEFAWMSKHALRTLIKQGNTGALRFLGFHPTPKIKIDRFKIITRAIKPGDAIEFCFDVTAERDEPLIIDYVIDFVKSNGVLAPKVHKLKQMSLKKGETVALRKRHVLRANATTYTLYPGTHHVTLQINGKRFDSGTFELRS